MHNIEHDLKTQLEATIRNAALNLGKLHRQAHSSSGPAALEENSVIALQMRDKSTASNLRIFQEMVMAAYCNRDNPDWDPARPETYRTQLEEHDLLRYLLDDMESMSAAPI